MRRSFGLAVAFPVLCACGDPGAPKPEPSNQAASAKGSSSASAQPVASAAPTAATPSSAPSAEAPAPSASAAASAAPLVPSEAPSADAPTAEEFQAHTQEINVKASGEQKCSTKVLRGWFELACGPADGLVRAKKVEVLSGFDAAKAITEPSEDLTTLRWVAPLPADGSLSQARMHGPRLHEIFITLTNGEKGWSGQLSGKKP